MPSKPFKITLRPSVLSKSELKYLLNVPTNKNQARRIYRRNLRLLKFLLRFSKPDFNSRTITINNGCPHCNGTCSICAWNNNINERQVPDFESCLEVKFGGFNYHDCQRRPIEILYSRDQANIIISKFYKDDWPHYSSDYSSKTFDSLSSEEQYEIAYESAFYTIRTFLEGHLEWAINVIKGAKKK